MRCHTKCTQRSYPIAEFNEGQPGMVGMKALARSYAWWPGITRDIETAIHLCKKKSQVLQSTPAMHHYIHGNGRNDPGRDCSDYAGPVQMHILFCLTLTQSFLHSNSYLKLTVVIEELRPLFARFGLLDTMVTDNGTYFVSAEFKNFLASNGYRIRHITPAPYHSATNGSADRVMQIMKCGLEKSGDGSQDWLSSYLLIV